MKIFKKKKKELTDDVKPRGIKYTIDRPSEADIAKLTKQRENMKKSFILYCDTLAVLDHLTDEQAGQRGRPGANPSKRRKPSRGL